jgi:serine/threonine protein kinase
MAKPAVNDVVDLIRRSGLVDDQKLAQVLSNLNEPQSDSGIICSSLINAGLLTQWQTEQLLSGRHRGFFLSKYKLLDKLGGGGMSNVYLAEHLEMGRRVAIKVLTSRLAQRPEYLDRFRQEARAAARVDHPNIDRAFDVGHEGEVHFLVMEYIEGTDLEKLVHDKGPLDGKKAAEYVRQAAVGLAHVHKAGLIHRDIKPANLLVDRTNTIKLVDLGLARLPEETIAEEAEDQVLGTVDYLAPEQSLDSHRVTPRVDIYSLGCTLYYLLSGRPPFPTGTLAQRVQMHRTQEPENLLELRPNLSLTLVAICQQMMAKSPDDRFANADEVVDVIQAWLEGRSSRILSLSALRLKRPNKPSPAAGSKSDDIELALAPLDDDATSQKPTPEKTPPTVDTKSAAKPTQDVNSALEEITDLEMVPVAKPPRPAVVLDEIKSDSGIPNIAAGDQSSILLAPITPKKKGFADGFPIWLMIACGSLLAVVVILFVWLLTRVVSG